MDTSETYVKMCEKAEEIQPEYLNYGDYYVWVSGNWYIWLDDNQSKRTKERVWIPRQDQLQEMINRTNYARPERQLIEDFYAFCNSEYDWYKFISMEQLWLAFVMKEKYSKAWNGEEWV